ncbi:MAG: hypothetical protein HRT36_08625 [Alphaproteobacteria bacterium]|nr:hypothetical protein [Alphaproteobacteria bacterium]
MAQKRNMVQMLYNRYERWFGVFEQIFEALGLRECRSFYTDDRRQPCESPSYCGQQGQKKRPMDKPSGGLNFRLYLICDGVGRPVSLSVTPG